MNSYPWYEIVKGSDPLYQGDLVDSCSVVVPTVNKNPMDLTGSIDEYNVVVMTQSCDIEEKKVNLVLVCPVWPLGQFLSNSTGFFKSKEGKEALRRGYTPGYHLLNKCEFLGFEREYLVVDFRSAFAVPNDYIIWLVSQSEKRIRLMPPYREHLSQAFARFFMRVGLPVQISSGYS